MNSPATGRQTILLADDSPTIQRLVMQTFSDSAFTVVSVNNGDAAIRAFDDSRPVVVLADIYMPGKNGYEVCTYIRARSTRASTPVILLVGAFDAFNESFASLAGATAHITKPFEPQALIELVTTLAEKAKALEAALPAPSGQADANDLLGLQQLFKPAAAVSPADFSSVLSAEQIDMIATRVLQKLSARVVEDIAWDIVPGIAAQVLREELKRTSHEG